jgi:predicted GNAT family acetyltransferase
MVHEVRRNDERGRYELLEDGEVVGFADFVDADESVVLPHTVIDPAKRGGGRGALLVQGALDDIRAQGRTVVPTCWYVRDYMAEHPETADLRAS